MVRFSEREYAALNRKRGVAPAAGNITTEHRRATAMSWECVTCRREGCGLVVHTEAAMRRHLRVHGVGARFECIPQPSAPGR